MRKPKDAPPGRSQPNSVTYVVVVHGIGEQRKNECVIHVVNRFAEARRGPSVKDDRDVLTLGQASGQTGFSKVPGTEQPWLEFDGIPASDDQVGGPFLGEPPHNGNNLRFVDLCWSDVMQDSVEHVGQDTDVWAKGLLGRLLRKHEAAAENQKAQVPLWIRRVLYLLADTLLLVRFAMNFRFKEMKELVFVKFLGDVQLYGEYSRCRGRAVRRFHEVMRSIEDAHKKAEEGSSSPRVARYIIIAHSLGSIMSFDALLYASATRNVRRGCVGQWEFPGYLRNEDKACEPDGLDELDELRPENSPLSKEEKLCNDPGWIDRVESFVTLGSPIDKYLMIWWSNYRYLLECVDHIQSRCPKIAHFNYCDELDPVGHNLDVARKTPGYRRVFECREDVVFNRYAVPGGAHNKYWTDGGLFRRILALAVDGGTAKSMQWFRPKVYWLLLLALYSLVPLLMLLGTFASLTLAFQAPGWRTAAVAAAVFSFLAYFGRRLIDLSIWWRQIQRKKWRACHHGDSDGNMRRSAEWIFRVLVAAAPIAWAALTGAAVWALDVSIRPGFFGSESAVRLALVLTVALVVAFLIRRRSLPRAYRTGIAEDAGSLLSRVEAAALVLVFVALIVLADFLAHVPDVAAGHDLTTGIVLFGGLATAVSFYRLYRFVVVKTVLFNSQAQEIEYSDYAEHP